MNLGNEKPGAGTPGGETKQSKIQSLLKKYQKPEDLSILKRIADGDYPSEITALAGQLVDGLEKMETTHA